HGEDIVVAIDNQARQQVCLAKDDAARVGVMRIALTEPDGCRDPLAQQGRQRLFLERVIAEQPDGNLRRAAVQRRSQTAATFMADLDQRSGWRFSGGQVRAIHPQMPAAQARRTLWADDENGELGYQASLLRIERLDLTARDRTVPMSSEFR